MLNHTGERNPLSEVVLNLVDSNERDHHHYQQEHEQMDVLSPTVENPSWESSTNKCHSESEVFGAVTAESQTIFPTVSEDCEDCCATQQQQESDEDSTYSSYASSSSFSLAREPKSPLKDYNVKTFSMEEMHMLQQILTSVNISSEKQSENLQPLQIKSDDAQDQDVALVNRIHAHTFCSTSISEGKKNQCTISENNSENCITQVPTCDSEYEEEEVMEEEYEEEEIILEEEEIIADDDGDREEILEISVSEESASYCDSSCLHSPRVFLIDFDSFHDIDLTSEDWYSLAANSTTIDSEITLWDDDDSIYEEVEVTDEDD